MTNRRKSKQRRNHPARPSSTPSPAQPSQQRQLEHTVTYTVESAFSGPLPSPDMMEHYDRIVPGFSAALLAEYQAQGSHRRGLEAAVIGGDLKAQSRGQFLGALMFVSVIVGAVVCAIAGQPVAAVAIAGLDIVGFGGLYVFGRRRQERERDEVR